MELPPLEIPVPHLLMRHALRIATQSDDHPVHG